MHTDILDIPVLTYFLLHCAVNTNLWQRLISVWCNVTIFFLFCGPKEGCLKMETGIQIYREKNWTGRLNVFLINFMILARYKFLIRCYYGLQNIDSLNTVLFLSVIRTQTKNIKKRKIHFSRRLVLFCVKNCSWFCMPFVYMKLIQSPFVLG